MGLIRDAIHRVRYALWDHLHAGGTSGTAIAHSALTGVTADQHHTQAHTLGSHSTKAHNELTGVGANDHHAQAHTLDSHSNVNMGALANNDLLQYHDPTSKWVNRTLATAGVASSAVDAAAGVGSLRTLGTGALQAAAGNHSQFVNRGDPAAYDWLELGTKLVLRTDGTWRDLDCLAKVPECAGAKAIVFALMVQDNLAGQSFNLRRNGNVNSNAYVGANTNVANIQIYTCVVVPCDANQVVEYIGSNTAWSSIALTIMGWWY